MLDTETDLVHFFKKTKDLKPFQNLPLSNGILSDEDQVDIGIGEANGEPFAQSFKF